MRLFYYFRFASQTIHYIIQWNTHLLVNIEWTDHRFVWASSCIWGCDWSLDIEHWSRTFPDKDRYISDWDTPGSKDIPLTSRIQVCKSAGYRYIQARTSKWLGRWFLCTDCWVRTAMGCKGSSVFPEVFGYIEQTRFLCILEDTCKSEYGW